MKGIVKENRWIEVDGKEYRISKNQNDIKPELGTSINVELINEYPEGCDNNPFCDGDETCMICYYNNTVAKVLK
jgi:hypothetical protein